MSLRSRGLSRFRKQWPEKRAFITDEAARLFCEVYCLLNVWIDGSVLAVLFVGRKTRKAEHRQGDVARSFGWQKVAMMDAAEPRHQLKPHGAVSFEVGELVQMDLVTQVTSNHLRCSSAKSNGPLVISSAAVSRHATATSATAAGWRDTRSSPTSSTTNG